MSFEKHRRPILTGGDVLFNGTNSAIIFGDSITANCDYSVGGAQAEYSARGYWT